MPSQSKMSIKTPEEKRSANKKMLAGCLSLFILGPVFLIAFAFNVDNLLHPIGIGQIIAGVGIAILLLTGSLFGVGLVTYAQDREVRRHKGPDPIVNPPSHMLTFFFVAVPALAGIGLILNYSYLLVGSVGSWTVGIILMFIVVYWIEKDKATK